jgi:hypothetical protein
MNRQQLQNAASVSYETRWEQLIADKATFVKEMQSLQKDHDEKRRLNRWANTGNYDYMMMQLVWMDYHANGQKSTPASSAPLPAPHSVASTDATNLPLEPELPKVQWRTLMLMGATPFERLWGQLATDKPSFIAKMHTELKKHREWKAQHPETPTGGNNEYMMMHWVWHHYHGNGGGRVPPPHLRNDPPPPPPNPYGGQFVPSPSANNIPNEWRGVNYSAQPALTQTHSHEQVPQWVQGNRIIMRPVTREVMPGEPMSSVRIVR